jgi:hypothetical protein
MFIFMSGGIVMVKARELTITKGSEDCLSKQSVVIKLDKEEIEVPLAIIREFVMNEDLREIFVGIGE